MNDIKKKINEKEIFENRLNDIINESRNNIDNKMKLIINLLSSIKDENEQIMSKSKYIS
jgi:hypothetical protein